MGRKTTPQALNQAYILRTQGCGIGYIAKTTHIATTTLVKFFKRLGLSHIGLPVTGRRLSPRQTKKPRDKTKISWLAGIFDTEGNIFENNRRKNLKNTIEVCAEFSDTNLDIMTAVRRDFGGFYKIKYVNPKWTVIVHKKPVYTWRVDRIKDVCAVCKMLIPYLRSNAKRQEAIRVVNRIHSKYPNLQSGNLPQLPSPRYV